LSDYKLITTRQEGRVQAITLNRPEKRNALSLDLCQELVQAFDHADHSSSVGAIVLNANGPVFCAGMDLTEAVEIDQNQLARIHDRLFTMIHRLRTPIVAAVNGAALAGGTGLVANAHIVVAGPDATFGLTEVRIGFWPMMIYRALEQAMGPRRTLELSLTGRIFNANDGLEYGLVTEISEDAEKRAHDIAAQLAAYSPLAIGTGLDYVRQIHGHDWEHAGKVGHLTRSRLIESKDFHEGCQAFREKRQPSWPSLKAGH
jgi:enoyl-CoA hydratase/carnithine racemase